MEPFTEAHVRERFDQSERARLRGEELHLAVVDATDLDHILGCCALYDVNRGEGRAAVGYWPAAHARGRGIATRAVRLMARWAIEHLAVARLELTCAPDNVASQHVALRCGFVREGVLRSHLRWQGNRRDTMIFSLLPGELRTGN